MKKFIAKCYPEMIAGLFFVLFCGAALGGCHRRGEAYLTPDTRETARSTEERQESEQEDFKEDGAADASLAGEVCVYVCGAVKRPGLYTLPADSRIGDAVEAAGGMKKSANREYWNLAELLTDGRMIDVPTREESAARGRESEETAAENTQQGRSVDGAQGTGDREDAKININTADREELQRIPGIGAVRADNIIAYREINGGFSHIEDIKKVNGIGEGLYRNLCAYITV